MKRQLFVYAGVLSVTVGLDLLRPGFIAKLVYQQDIGHPMADKHNVPVAATVLFHAAFAVGLVVFAVLPAGPALIWGESLAMAALFTFFAYATCDVTNLATLKQWPMGLSLLDITSGTCVSAAAAAGGKALMTTTRSQHGLSKRQSQ